VAAPAHFSNNNDSYRFAESVYWRNGWCIVLVARSSRAIIREMHCNTAPGASVPGESAMAALLNVFCFPYAGGSS